MAGRIYLGGGGSAADEASLWHEFVFPGVRVLYWPVALPSESHGAAKDWLAHALTAFGAAHLSMWSNLSEHGSSELSNFDLIFVGGGNTFALLHQVQRSGFHVAVPSFLAGGGHIYGGSAGAIVMGADISIAAMMDEDIDQIPETTGLGLLGNYVVLPHFEAHLEAEVREWVLTNERPVLALTDQSGLVVEKGIAWNVGPGDVRVFEKTTALSMPPLAPFRVST